MLSETKAKADETMIGITKHRSRNGVSLYGNRDVSSRVAKGSYRITSTLIRLFLLLAISMSLVSPLKMVTAQSVSQSYHTASSLPVGTLVSLQSAGSNDVVTATISNQNLVQGVVSQTTNALIDVKPQGSNVQVVNQGTVQLLVNTVGGSIKNGDSLVISPLAGIAMKPGANEVGRRYVAIAKQAFNDQSNGATKLSVKTEGGSSKQVSAGLISAELALDKGTVAPGIGQNSLTRAVERLTGQQVTTSRVIASSAIALTSIMVTGVLLQGAVRGTFVSLGRNPLAHANVIPALMRVIILSVVFLGCGFTIAYATLVI